jgi:hypothetical protein
MIPPRSHGQVPDIIPPIYTNGKLSVRSSKATPEGQGEGKELVLAGRCPTAAKRERLNVVYVRCAVILWQMSGQRSPAKLFKSIDIQTDQRINGYANEIEIKPNKPLGKIYSLCHTEAGMSDSNGHCNACGTVHDWMIAEHLSCVPPLNVLRFGTYNIPRAYRDALYQYAPYYCTEEVVGSFLGHNPYFSSYDDWANAQRESESEDSESESEDSEE